MIRELLSRFRVGKLCAAMVMLMGLATQAWALGLGEIELNSSLNEKLDASIEIYDAAGLQPTEILVSMAGADDFSRVGVERFFFLTDIRFEVVPDRNGVRSVKLSSSQPITEPYLNFLVEVIWPNGRLLKEYTLLLDPPTFGQAAAPQVAAPSRAAETASAGRVERAPVTGTGTRVQMAETETPAKPSPLDEGVVDGEYRMTDREDTLWSIASRTRPSSKVSVDQNMLAIQRLNPEAFLHGNINYLKAGYTLRLPTEGEALSIGEAEATQMVARQHEDWRALSRGEQVTEGSAPPAPAGLASEGSTSELRGQVDATREVRPTDNAARGAGGELRIVAGEGDSVSGVPAASSDPEQLSSAMEEQDRLTREVEELTYQLDREKELAANQLAVKERQLEVKDQQIAEMQAEMERIRQELDQLKQAENQNQSTARSAGSRAEEPWWQSTYAMVGAAGVVVLLLVYGLIAARRKRAQEESFDPEQAMADAPEEDVEAVHALSGGAVAVSAVAEAAEREPEPDLEAMEEAQDSETSDVIGEADIYIAYGRYPQAISLLLGVLAEDPERNDVRFKLLELYAETRDRAAFDEQMTELLARCDDEEALLSARELAQQFGGSESEQIEPVALDESLAEDESVLQDAAAEADEEIVLEAESQEEAADQRAALDSATPPADELEFLEADGAGERDANGESETNGFHDFELEFDEPEAIAAPEAESEAAREPEAVEFAGREESAGAGDQLGGDLGIDFKLDDDVLNGSADEALDALDDETAADEALAGFDDVELDLDLDLSGDDIEPEDEFDFGDDTDVATTKLDLARAYIDMGDEDGARDILGEVLTEGNPEQRQQAQALLEGL